MGFSAWKTALALPVVAALTLLASQSFAMPVESVVWEVADGGNGHTYLFVPLKHNVSWDEANSAAEAMTLSDGSVGYLATITSLEERKFIQSEVLPHQYWAKRKAAAWIGEEEDEFLLVGGKGWHGSWSHDRHRVVNTELSPERWRYSKWRGEHEPSNDTPIHERFLTKWFHHYRHGHDWSDDCNDGHPGFRKPWIIGMIVEFDPPDVPEPATALLAALGIALLGLRRRS